jgi:hypothetical protein
VAKPSREVLLQCSTTIFQTLFDTYQNRIHTLNQLEKSIYEGAGRHLARELLPYAESKAVIEKFDQELQKKRDAAAKAREAKQKQGGNTDGNGNTSGAQAGSPAA